MQIHNVTLFMPIFGVGNSTYIFLMTDILYQPLPMCNQVNNNGQLIAYEITRAPLTKWIDSSIDK